jgi:pyruvate carboxylase subunit B
MVHPDVISVHAMLKDAGFKVPDINMTAYMETRRLTQSFIDDFLGYFIDDRNKLMTSLLVGCGLPGGMMGSLMADLKGVHSGINSYLKDNNKKEISTDELLVKLFDEVKYIWPMLGNPPLVTPFSQYVKNIALMNVMFMTKGQARWTMIDKNSWDMILGKAGELPGKLDQEIVTLAKKNKYEFYEGNPQDNYPNELDRFINEMKVNGWDRGQDDEELFEFAMHEKQYRDFKSGEAKKRFDLELEAAIKEKYSKQSIEIPNIRLLKYPDAEPIVAPVSGRMIWELDYTERSTEPIHGKLFNENDTLCTLQTRYGLELISSFCTGRIVGVEKKQGEMVHKGDVIAYLQTKGDCKKSATTAETTTTAKTATT